VQLSSETAPVGLRSLTAADQDLLATFVLMAVFAPDRPLPSAPLTAPPATRWLAPWSSSDVGVVLDADGEVAGLAIARQVEPAVLTGAAGGSIPEVLIAVREERRGTGHGGALLSALRQAASAAGHPELALTVSPRNPARRLYLRQGFSVVSRTDAGLEVLVSGRGSTRA
jgi:GNAT superfamily N-acetyltransferase